MHVKLPNRELDAFVKDGSGGRRMGRILEAARPEAVYFTEHDGRREAIMIVEVAGPSDVPRLAGPWFATFNDTLDSHIATSPDDLREAAPDIARE